MRSVTDRADPVTLGSGRCGSELARCRRRPAVLTGSVGVSVVVSLMVVEYAGCRSRTGAGELFDDLRDVLDEPFLGELRGLSAAGAQPAWVEERQCAKDGQRV